MKVLFIKRADGGVSYGDINDNADPAAEVKKWEGVADKAWLPCTFDVLADRSSIPEDRTFRDAWIHNGSKIEHDIEKCRELHKDRLRSIRAPLLADLDVAYMRAVEDGDTKAQSEIAAKKQALRDVTGDPAIDAAQTPSDLKVPDALR